MEEAAAARTGKESMSKSQDQWRARTKRNKRREEGGEVEEGEVDEHMEPGLKHPGKKCTQTGTTG